MKITCPDCATSYRVSDMLIGPEGRNVKCARCGARWTAHEEDDTASIETDLPATASDARVPEMAEAMASAAAKGPSADDPLSSVDDDDSVSDDDWGAAMAEAAPADTDTFDRDSDTQENGTPGGDDAAFDSGDALMSVDFDADGGPGDGANVSDGDDDDGNKPVDIETLARRPKIQHRPREDEPALRRLAKGAVARARHVHPRRVVGAGILIAALSLFALAVVLRTPIVARFPDLAGLYALAGFEVNLRGLEFRDLRTFRELDNGAIVLVIEGTVANVTDKDVYVPAVRFALRSEDAQEIYAWVVEPRARRLDKGETTRIRTRLASPPDLAAGILVRFVDRGRAQNAKLR